MFFKVLQSSTRFGVVGSAGTNLAEPSRTL
jgi:hypothetical protein